MKKPNDIFCTRCNTYVKYHFERENIRKIIKDKEYTFSIRAAVCNECNAKLGLPGLIDENVRDIDTQYREYENLVTLEDLNNLLDIYDIGKQPLAQALGIGEATIFRYFQGQVPSKEYSAIIKHALMSPSFMRLQLTDNRAKVGETAFNKSIRKIDFLEKTFSGISEKLLSVIAYIIQKMEVTPLALQKLLYYIQGLFFLKYQKLMFPDNCEAWCHGPVYSDVYNVFKDFKFNPIDDKRFLIIKGMINNLNKEDKDVIDLVLSTFGEFNGKILEDITHKEDPWLHARIGYDFNEPSNVIIEQESIKKYFCKINTEFNMSTYTGIHQYISKMRSA